MATTRKVAKIADGRSRTVEQPTEREVTNDLLQKLFEQPISKFS